MNFFSKDDESAEFANSTKNVAFSTKVIETIYDLQYMHTDCKKGVSHKVITQNIETKYALDGDISTQVQICLNHLEDNGLVSRCNGLYKLIWAVASIMDSPCYSRDEEVDRVKKIFWSQGSKHKGVRSNCSISNKKESQEKKSSLTNNCGKIKRNSTKINDLKENKSCDKRMNSNESDKKLKSNEECDKRFRSNESDNRLKLSEDDKRMKSCESDKRMKYNEYDKRFKINENLKKNKSNVNDKTKSNETNKRNDNENKYVKKSCDRYKFDNESKRLPKNVVTKNVITKPTKYITDYTGPVYRFQNKNPCCKCNVCKCIYPCKYSDKKNERKGQKRSNSCSCFKSYACPRMTSHTCVALRNKKRRKKNVEVEKSRHNSKSSEKCDTSAEKKKSKKSMNDSSDDTFSLSGVSILSYRKVPRSRKKQDKNNTFANAFLKRFLNRD